MKRAVKYCGGCNPRFDRRALVQQIEQKLGQPLLPARVGIIYDEIYIVNGCLVRCANTTDLTAHKWIELHSAELPDSF